jgi:hypothetical protein
MEPVKISRNLINNWWYTTNNPSVWSTTVIVRLREQDWQPLDFFLTRRWWSKKCLSFEFIRLKRSSVIWIFNANVVRELTNRVETFLAPIVRQEEIIPAINLVRLKTKNLNLLPNYNWSEQDWTESTASTYEQTLVKQMWTLHLHNVSKS